MNVKNIEYRTTILTFMQSIVAAIMKHLADRELAATFSLKPIERRCAKNKSTIEKT